MTPKETRSSVVRGGTDASDFDELACWRAGAVANPYCDEGWRVSEVRRLWTNPGFPEGDPDTRHNAFTGLARFEDHWYCGFRTGADHGGKGTLRVLRSPDGKAWTEVFHLVPKEPGTDLRDTKLTVTASGELMMISMERYIDETTQHYTPRDGLTRRTFTTLSADGTAWTGPHYDEGVEETWIWSVTWHGGVGYGVAYGGRNKAGALYKTADGRTWEIVTDALFPPPTKLEKKHGSMTGNEGTLVFDPDGTAHLYLRGGPRSGGAHLGTAKPPYTDWTWKSRIRRNIGGPMLVRLADGRYVIGGRKGYGTPTAKNNTVLWELDPAKAHFREILRLPSGGDCSYPGIVEHEGELWISYYSTHEDPNPEGRNVWNQRGSIYLARVRIGAAPAE